MPNGAPINKKIILAIGIANFLCFSTLFLFIFPELLSIFFKYPAIIVLFALAYIFFLNVYHLFLIKNQYSLNL